MFIMSAITVVNNSTHVDIYDVRNILLLFFWVIVKLEMPKYLRIQKPNIRHFSVSGFVVALMPSAIDG